jgi:hypothetical protein
VVQFDTQAPEFVATKSSPEAKQAEGAIYKRSVKVPHFRILGSCGSVLRAILE